MLQTVSGSVRNHHQDWLPETPCDEFEVGQGAAVIAAIVSVCGLGAQVIEPANRQAGVQSVLIVNCTYLGAPLASR